MLQTTSAASPESRSAEPSFLAIQDLLQCPTDGSPLDWDRSVRQLKDRAGPHTFDVQSGIPCLFAPNAWPEGKSDVTDIVKEFYEETPFPNYDDLDSRDSLRRKARQGVFARLLDEQIPNTATVLEVGCGTGQMTNFLAMGWGRTCVGADLCLNSLRLAKSFRDRFSIKNAHFIQMNLFRPAVKPAAFDVVISNGVLHHTSDCAAAFRSIVPLVRSGGFIIVGLYNWLGRLPTLWRRWLIEKFGAGGALLDPRLRGKGETARQGAWFMDQYRHPHETKHSIDEVLAWFDRAGVDFMSCVPTIGDVEFSEDIGLFEPHATGRYLDRLSTELEMLLSGGSDGGLYIMIGRKQ